MLTEEEYLQKWLDAYIESHHPDSNVAPVIITIIQDFLNKCGLRGQYSFKKSIKALSKTISNIVEYKYHQVYESDVKMLYVVRKLERYSVYNHDSIQIPLVHQEKEWTKDAVDRILARVTKFRFLLTNIEENKDIHVPYSSQNKDIVEAIARGDMKLASTLTRNRMNAYTKYAYGYVYMLQQENLPEYHGFMYPRGDDHVNRTISLSPYDYISFSFDSDMK